MSDWQAQIEAATKRIKGHIIATPVTKISAFGLGYPIELKFEQMQHMGTFKARGAFNTLIKRPVPEAGIVAASGGNHGAAVAYAASQLGHRARIFVPEIAGPSKIELIKRAGADLEVVKGAYADAFSAAQAYEDETGALQVHAYDGPGTVEGQGTLFKEWEEQGLEADTVFVAVGGGGLIGGGLAWLQGRRKVVAVESELTATLATALRDGPDAEVEVSGVTANALGARRIGRVCYDLARAQDIETLTLPDQAILDAQKALWQELRQFVEPAGATALAALTSGAYTPAPDERVAVLVCGANPIPDPFL